jgi:hypothetical protein
MLLVYGECDIFVASCMIYRQTDRQTAEQMKKYLLPSNSTLQLITRITGCRY